MPSGDRALRFRVSVPRAEGSVSRQKVDALECCAWNGRVRRSVQAWQVGDVVEVVGVVRRRFFRHGGGAASRVEVEVLGGKRLVKARDAS